MSTATPTNSELTPEELRTLAKRLIAEPSSTQNLSENETTALRKFLNPMGGVISSKDSYANLSIINWKDKDLRRMHMTGLIGYLFRSLEEYEPEWELEQERNRYAAALKQARASGATQEALEKLGANHNQRMLSIKKSVKGVIENFLNRNFKFNPDQHVRKAHTDAGCDPERAELNKKIMSRCKLAERAPHIEKKLCEKEESTFAYMRANLLETYQAAGQITSSIESLLTALTDPTVDVEDAQGILLKRFQQMESIHADLAKIAVPLASADTMRAWKTTPPADVYHQFGRYFDNHYEQIRDIVSAAYDGKPDIEFSVIFYDAFKTAESAHDYKVQHEKEITLDMLTVKNNQVTLLGPFKENRSRLDFYNKNTEIFKRMMKNAEAEQKLGADFGNKSRANAKKKNIAEAGPDAPGLAAYSKAMNVAQELGAKKGLTREEQIELQNAKDEARRIKEDYEVPDDAIQVDFFVPTEDADGNTILERRIGYTQAEEPLFLQEGSEFQEKYQPAREEGVDAEYTTKIITSRTGEKKEIRTLREELAGNK